MLKSLTWIMEGDLAPKQMQDNEEFPRPPTPIVTPDDTPLPNPATPEPPQPEIPDDESTDSDQERRDSVVFEEPDAPPVLGVSLLEATAISKQLLEAAHAARAAAETAAARADEAFSIKIEGLDGITQEATKRAAKIAEKAFHSRFSESLSMLTEQATNHMLSIDSKADDVSRAVAKSTSESVEKKMNPILRKIEKLQDTTDELLQRVAELLAETKFLQEQKSLPLLEEVKELNAALDEVVSTPSEEPIARRVVRRPRDGCAQAFSES